jgi:hypothetical protein
VLGDNATLTDELIEPLFADRAVALIVKVNAVSSVRWLSVYEHAKRHGRSSRRQSHDQMQVAGVEALQDPPVGRVQQRGLPLNRPIT